MNAELEIVVDAYNYNEDGKFKKDLYLNPKYSIKLPNDMTGMELHRFMDGDQPGYHAGGYLNMLEEYDLCSDDGLADYPRHGNTKRIFYKDIEKAQAALFFLKKYNKEVV